MDFKTLNKSNQFHYTMPENAEFKNLKELNPDYIYILVTVHMNTKGKFGTYPIGVNDDKCKFKVKSFHSKKYNRTGFGIEFL